MDALPAAALEAIQAAITQYREAVSGISPDGLAWAPGPDTNSISALVAHSVAATLFWLGAAADAGIDRRAFEAENATTFSFCADGAGLGRILDRLEREAAAILGRVDPAEYDRVRSWPTRPAPVTGAWCILHAVEHLREHLGAATLTRQLWSFQGGK